jgi:hypothetical protein
MATLATLLVPSGKWAKERTQRALCRENLRRLGVAAHIYAEANRGHLFQRLRDDGVWICWEVPAATFSQITNLAGERAIDCPNLYPFTMPGLIYDPGGRLDPRNCMLIGYNYCGAVAETDMQRRFGWVSPVRTSDDPTLPLFVDANNCGYINGYWAVVPHAATGSLRIGGSAFVTLGASMNPRDLGAEGGNIGTLDGSVRWKPIRQMKLDHWTFRDDFGDRGMW